MHIKYCLILIGAFLGILILHRFLGNILNYCVYCLNFIFAYGSLVFILLYFDTGSRPPGSREVDPIPRILHGEMVAATFIDGTVHLLLIKKNLLVLLILLCHK